MKDYWFKFEPNAWLADRDLRRCGHAAKGVWIDMLCLMHQCDERGVLATSGRAWTQDEIAQAVGGDQSMTLSCIKELLAAGVASVNNAGAIFSRRMVRDTVFRERCSEAGKKGGGNPTFKGMSKGTPKGTPKGIPKGMSKGTPKAELELESELEKENTGPACAGEPPPSPRQRKPDPIWDSLLTVFPAPTNDAERGRWNKACKLLRQSQAAPERIQEAANAYRRRWPNADCNPMALATHWAEFGSDKPVKSAAATQTLKDEDFKW